MDRVEKLQYKNDKLEKEIMEMIDDLFDDETARRDLKSKIQSYANIAFLLGVEEGKDS